SLNNSKLSVTGLPNFFFGPASQIATGTGSGFLNEWDVVTVNRPTFASAVTETAVKVWGEAAANGGKPFPIGPIAPGGTVPILRHRLTDANKTLLLSYQFNVDPTGGYAIQVPVAGRAPVKPFLP